MGDGVRSSVTMFALEWGRFERPVRVWVRTWVVTGMNCVGCFVQ